MQEKHAGLTRISSSLTLGRIMTCHGRTLGKTDTRVLEESALRRCGFACAKPELKQVETKDVEAGKGSERLKDAEVLSMSAMLLDYERYEEVRQLLEEHCPMGQRWELKYNLGYAYAALGEEERALRFFKRMEDAYWYLANGYYHLKKYEDALRNLEELLRCTKGAHVYSANEMLGMVYEKLGRFDEAIEVYKKIGRERDIAEAYEKAGRFEEAISAYKQLRKDQYGRFRPGALQHMGDIELKLGWYRRAKRSYDKVLEILDSGTSDLCDGELNRLHENRSLVYEKLGLTDPRMRGAPEILENGETLVRFSFLARNIRMGSLREERERSAQLLSRIASKPEIFGKRASRKAARILFSHGWNEAGGALADMGYTADQIEKLNGVLHKELRGKSVENVVFTVALVPAIISGFATCNATGSIGYGFLGGFTAFMVGGISLFYGAEETMRRLAFNYHYKKFSRELAASKSSHAQQNENENPQP